MVINVYYAMVYPTGIALEKMAMLYTKQDALPYNRHISFQE